MSNETPQYKENIQPVQRRAAQGVADIVFLIDVTSSMQPCIDALKNSILHFIDELTSERNAQSVKDWRGRVVGFRDFLCDGEIWLENNPFTRNADELKRQLTSLVAVGGGDEPESLLDAMMMTIDSGSLEESSQSESPEDAYKWRPRNQAARCLVVFTDASYHEQASVPKYAGKDAKDLFALVKEYKIYGFMFVPEIAQYYDTVGRFPKFAIHGCGMGADGLGGVMSNPDRLQEVLDRLQAGISQSASTIVDAGK